MKRINKIWLFPLLMMGLVLILITNCKKDKDEENQEIPPIPSLTADNLTVNQLEIVALTPSNINFHQTEYSGSIGGQSVNLLLCCNKLVFMVPEISAGTQTLTTTIEGNDYTLLFVIQQLATVTDAQQVVDTVLLPALLNNTQLDSLESIVQQLDADSNWVQNKTILKNYYYDFTNQFTALSATDKLQLAKIIKANEGIFSQLLNVRNIIDSTNISKSKGDYDYEANLTEGSNKIVTSKIQLVLLILPTAIAINSCITVPTPVTCGFAAVCVAALSFKLYLHNTLVKVLLDKVYEPFQVMLDDLQEKSEIMFQNNQMYGFSVSLNIRTLYSPDMNSTIAGVLIMVTQLNESATVWADATALLPEALNDKPAHINNKNSYLSKNFVYSGTYFSVENISNPEVSIASQNIVGGVLRVAFTTSAGTDQDFNFALKYNKGQYIITQNVSATLIISEPYSIDKVSGDNQTGQPGQALADPITVIVKDQADDPFNGAKVNFAANNGGNVSQSQVITGTNGIASVIWTLGSNGNQPTLTITSFKSDNTTPLQGSPLTFTATNIEPYSIEVLSGDNQTGTLGQQLSEPIKAIVKDIEGNPFLGTSVNFIANNGGSVSQSQVTTGSDGIASVNWTLGNYDDSQTVTVTAFESNNITPLQGSPLTFTATTIEPYSIEVLSGDNQTGTLGQQLSEPIKAIVKDIEGNPFQGTSVNFIANNGGSVSQSQVTTGSDGIASVTWTLGNYDDSQTVTVTAFESNNTTPLQGSPLTFTATTIEPYSIEILSGDNQTGTLGQQLPEPIKAIIKDIEGNPYPGTSVNFIANNGGTVSQSQVTTGADGIASVNWTLGSTGNTHTLTVTAFKTDNITPLQGSPLTYTATSCSTFMIGGYEAVQIGTQIWMARNLNIATADSWCYDNNPTMCAEYGRLYTWDAALSACPGGWHLPSYDVCFGLYEFLGESAGGKLKEAGTTHWSSPNTGATNETCFTGLPGGYSFEGGFYSLGFYGTFWTSTEVDENVANYWSIGYLNPNFGFGVELKTVGNSVRCVKD